MGADVATRGLSELSTVTVREITDSEMELIIAGTEQRPGLVDWLCATLSIKQTDENLKRVRATLPEIKYHCLSMTIPEVKRAFEKYVRGELSLDPSDNYLTPILFGKVIRAYKDSLPKKTKAIELPKLSKEDEQELAKENLLMAYDHFQENGEVSENFISVFDRLLEWGKLPRPGKNPAADKRYSQLLNVASVEVMKEVEREIEKEKAKPGAGTPRFFELRKIKSEWANLADDYRDHELIQTRMRKLVLEGYFSKVKREDL